eukprot:TRINITY_DN32718_c0_g1_i1.p1 TRINITY_DN32718_c0_g1~~TRINITY_DN32718_c0_g1_i1.p1  ORF type:complete len:637 (+),score=209.42 TRINITY_DN32718_c0_g1_i1:296-2206(+)
MEHGPDGFVVEFAAGALELLNRLVKGCSSASSRKAVLNAACGVIERAAHTPEALHTISRTQLPRLVSYLLEKSSDTAHLELCTHALSRVIVSSPGTLRQHAQAAARFASAGLDSESSALREMSAQLIGLLPRCKFGQVSWEGLMHAVLRELEQCVGLESASERAAPSGVLVFELAPVAPQSLKLSSVSLAAALARRARALCSCVKQLLGTDLQGEPRAVPAAQILALLQHLNNSSASSPWHGALPQLRQTEAVLLLPVLQAEVVTLVGQLALAARRRMLPLQAKLGRGLVLLAQSTKDQWQEATRAQVYLAASHLIQALGPCLKDSLALPLLALALADIRNSVQVTSQQATTLKQATSKGGRQNKRHKSNQKTTNDTSPDVVAVPEPSAQVVQGALQLVRTVLEQCGAVLAGCNRVEVDSVLVDTLHKTIFKSTVATRSLQASLLGALLAAVLAPSATASPLIPHAVLVCKAIALDTNCGAETVSLCNTVLAVCTSSIQPKAPAKFEATLVPEFSHEAVSLYSSRVVASMAAGEALGSNAAKQPEGSLFGAPKPQPVPPSVDTKQPEAVIQETKPTPVPRKESASKPATRSQPKTAPAQANQSKKRDNEAAAMNLDSDSDDDIGLVDDSPDASDEE